MSNSLKLLAAAISLVLSSAVQAVPVTFQVSMSALNAGTGYGLDADEASGTKINAGFTQNNAIYNFVLSNPGDFYDFNIGTIFFNESGTVNAAEQAADLDVTAFFTFWDPFLGSQIMQANGTAQFGAIDDIPGPSDLVDYRLNWDSETVFFSFGSFEVSILNKSFAINSAQQEGLIARITLRDVREPDLQVPEPSSLALLGLAFAGLGMMRKRFV